MEISINPEIEQKDRWIKEKFTEVIVMGLKGGLEKIRFPELFVYNRKQ